jgi:hypothetical protein
VNPVLLEAWRSRLENWALWVTCGTSQTSAGVSSIYRSNGYRFDFTTRPPAPLIGDASDVDALILRLADVHRDALRATYVWTGSIQLKARQLGVCVDTLRNRTIAATWKLDDLDRKRMARTAQNHPRPI